MTYECASDLRSKYYAQKLLTYLGFLGYTVLADHKLSGAVVHTSTKNILSLMEPFKPIKQCIRGSFAKRDDRVQHNIVIG